MAAGDEVSLATKIALVVSCIVTGAYSTVLMKHVFESDVVLPDGTMTTTFHCPFFANFLNCFAMGVLVALQMLFSFARRTWDDVEDAPERTQPCAIAEFGGILRYIFGMRNLGLSFIGTFASICTQTALVMVPATIHAVLRQGNIPVTVVLRMYLFDSTFSRKQWSGICILGIGLFVMGVVTKHNDAELVSPSNATWGLILMIVASVLLGGRYVIEEKVVQHEDIPPLVMAGAQGLVGCIISAIYSILAHCAGLEDFWFVVAAIRDNQRIQILLTELFVMTIAYNFFMAYTIKVFDATCKALVRGTKPVSVWVLQLIWFYVITPTPAGKRFGEAWVYPTSWFVFLSAWCVAIGLTLYTVGSDKPKAPKDMNYVDYERMPLLK